MKKTGLFACFLAATIVGAVFTGAPAAASVVEKDNVTTDGGNEPADDATTSPDKTDAATEKDKKATDTTAVTADRNAKPTEKKSVPADKIDDVATRADWSSQGGATAKRGGGAMDFAIGFPSVTLMAHLPVVKHLEIDPFAEVFYWDNLHSTTPYVGTNLGARLKLNMVDRGKLQIALMADLAAGVVFYHIENGDNVGSGFNLRLTFPQFIISGRVTPKVHVFGGIKIPMTLYTGSGIEFSMVVAGNFGFEVMLTKRLNFYVSVDCGPEIRWGNRKVVDVVPSDPDGVAHPEWVVYEKGNWSEINGWLSTSVGLSTRF